MEHRSFRSTPLLTAPGRAGDPSLFAALPVLALAWAAWFAGSAWLLWAAFPPALWLAFASPVRLVQLLLVTTPVFPVLRLAQDDLGVQQVSTKGLFAFVDDPLVLALLIAWLARRLRSAGRAERFFPGALLALALLYPLVTAANLARLEPNQALVSLLYYLKWLQYAVLVFAIPQTVPGSSVPRLLSSLYALSLTALCVSAAFAVFEIVQALRTSSYTSAASFPRASAFFGSLDPARFGASEDPVSFGLYAAVAGSLALGRLACGAPRGRWLSLAGAGAAVISILTTASRTPVLAAATAFARIHRLRSAHLVLGAAAMAVAAGCF